MHNQWGASWVNRLSSQLDPFPRFSQKLGRGPAIFYRRGIVWTFFLPPTTQDELVRLFGIVPRALQAYATPIKSSMPGALVTGRGDNPYDVLTPKGRRYVFYVP